MLQQWVQTVLHQWNWTNWVLICLGGVILLQLTILYGVRADWWTLHMWYWWLGA